MSGRNSSLSARSIEGFNITITPNIFPRQQGRIYHFRSLQQLIKEAGNLLGLNTPAKKVFNEEGALVKADSDIQPRQTYVVSAGEPFKSPPKKKISDAKSDKNSKVSVEEEEEESSEKPKIQLRSALDSVAHLFKTEESHAESTPSTSSKSSEKTGPLPNINLPKSNKTVSDQFRDEALCQFSQLSKDQQAKTPNSLSIRAMIRNVQREYFIQNLIEQNIKSNLNLDDEVTKILFDHKPLSIQYAFVGPSKSGKSSLLYETAKSLYSKLQPFKVFVFVLNFEHSTDIFPSIIHSVISSMKYCAFQLNSQGDSLESWFLSLPEAEALPNFPLDVKNLGNADINAIIKLGQSLHQAYRKIIPTTIPTMFNNPMPNPILEEDVAAFNSVLATFPFKLAKAFGLEHVFSIIDHFDLCPKTISNFLANEIIKGPFLSTSRNDDALLKLLPTAEAVSTNNLSTTKDNRVLISHQLHLRLDPSCCLGVPTYLKAYSDLCDIIENMTEKKVVKNKYSAVKSTVDESRYLIANDKLKALCELLLLAESPNINSTIVNSIRRRAKIDYKIEYLPRPENEEEEEDGI